MSSLIAKPNEGGNAFMGLQALFSFDVKTVSHVTNWFLQLVFAANAATIVSGSIAERCHFSAYLAYSFIITGNLIFLKCTGSYEKTWLQKVPNTLEPKIFCSSTLMFEKYLLVCSCIIILRLFKFQNALFSNKWHLESHLRKIGH